MQQQQQTMTPQVRTLLNHLQKHESISQAEAATVYRIRALPRRISDLKEAGYNIRRELKTDPTGQRYARYFLDDKTPVVAEPPKLEAGCRIRVTNALGNPLYSNGDEGIVDLVDGDDDVWVKFDNLKLLEFLVSDEYEVIA